MQQTGRTGFDGNCGFLWEQKRRSLCPFEEGKRCFLDGEEFQDFVKPGMGISELMGCLPGGMNGVSR